MVVNVIRRRIKSRVKYIYASRAKRNGMRIVYRQPVSRIYRIPYLKVARDSSGRRVVIVNNISRYCVARSTRTRTLDRSSIAFRNPVLEQKERAEISLFVCDLSVSFPKDPDQ